MKKAFTMIELIFVIVIIGILASVAIPKLAATRDDAKISSIISSAKIMLGDLQTYYTARGNLNWQTQSITQATSVIVHTACGSPVSSATSISPNTFVMCNENVVCLTFETTSDGNLTITDGTNNTDRICETVKADPAILGLSNKTYKLGGQVSIR